MALTGETLAGLVYADYLASIPTAIDANRSNATMGVPTHNVPYELVSAISKGFASALLSMTVFDSYAGSAGGGSPSLVPPVFNTGLITTATATFLSSMGWAGTSSTSFTNIMLSSFFSNVASITQIQMNVLPGAGPGTGLINTGVNPGLGATMTSACSAAIISEITSTNKFNQDDISGGAPTAQISLLATNLSTAYGTIVGGLTGTVPYAGTASTPTTALSAVNSGKFV